MASRPRQEVDRRGLCELASDLDAIARRLAAIGEGRSAREVWAGLGTAEVSALLAARQARAEAFGLDLLHPGWSLLLVLLRAHLEAPGVRSTRLAEEAQLPSTTMLRWMELLLRAGLAERRPAADHPRGVLYALTPDGAERVLRQVAREAGNHFPTGSSFP
jgi:DNA-binding MarR family transcriptional regulator